MTNQEFETILFEYLADADLRVQLYSQELKDNNIDDEELLQLCIESNYQFIHDSLCANYYETYKSWRQNARQLTNNYSRWLEKQEIELEEIHCKRYEKYQSRLQKNKPKYY